MEPVSHNIGDLLLKTIMKYRFNPSIVAINKNCNLSLSFSFSQIKRDEIMKGINNLKTNKVTKAQTCPLNLLRKSLIFLEILFLEIIVIAFPILFFQTP